MAVIVACLHSADAMRLETPTDFLRHPDAGQQGFDAGPNALCLELWQRVFDRFDGPGRERCRRQVRFAAIGRDGKFAGWLALGKGALGRLRERN